MKTILFSTVFLWILHTASSYGPYSKEIYCERVHCPEDNHIYCNDWRPFHSGFLGNDPNRIILTSNQKQLILDTHNELRNIVASGMPRLMNLAGDTFPKALNMHKLVWNEELEWAAGLNGETCAGDHDCPSTHTYMFAGQNLAMTASSHDLNRTEFLKNNIRFWFMEHLNTPLDVIDGYSPEIVKHSSQFTAEETRKVAEFIKPVSMVDMNGHFTALVKDTTSKIGCALYSCGKVDNVMTDSYSLYLVCNYENSNMIGEATYEHKTSYDCERSRKFPGLCLDGSDTEEDSDDVVIYESDIRLPSFGGGGSSAMMVFLTGVPIYVCLIVNVL